MDSHSNEHIEYMPCYVEPSNPVIVGSIMENYILGFNSYRTIYTINFIT
jgi:hypothetical protein